MTQPSLNVLRPFNGLFLDLNPQIVESFLDFNKKNPNIYQLFKRFALEVRETGRRHYGAKAIMERIRWEIEIQRNADFKINNNYTSCYTRLLIFFEPSFANFFETRHTPGTILEVH